MKPLWQPTPAEFEIVRKNTEEMRSSEADHWRNVGFS